MSKKVIEDILIKFVTSKLNKNDFFHNFCSQLVVIFQSHDKICW